MKLVHFAFLLATLFTATAKSDGDDISAMQAKADGGDVAAMLSVSRAYLFGRGGAEKNESLAFQYALRAAEVGHEEAFLLVGINYREGRGVKKSVENAYYWLCRAATSPSERLRSLGVLEVGQLLEQYEHVEGNVERIRSWYTVLADFYVSEAADRLASHYERHGLYKEAAWWYLIGERGGNESMRISFELVAGRLSKSELNNLAKELDSHKPKVSAFPKEQKEAGCLY